MKIKRIISLIIAAFGVASIIFTSILFVKSEETVVKITMLKEGLHDIYETSGAAGYRYGPTIIRNEDGTYEALFSTNPGDYSSCPDLGHSAADVLTYRTSSDGGMTWSDEVLSLIPTEGSPDQFSVCDPGFIKTDEWYYCAYTSTFDPTAAGVYNHVYAARTKNPTDYKSWQKWNGNGWSDFGAKDCKPIITYYGSAKDYGIGEPSMVVVDGKIYVYYTLVGKSANGKSVNSSRVAIGEFNGELWPQTLVDVGPVIRDRDAAEDAVDVKYIDDMGMFLALNTYNRMSRSSRLKFSLSKDGIYFKEMEVDGSACIERLHNSGMAGDTLGHIQLDKELFVGYAYAKNGVDWGRWSTAVQYFRLDISSKYNMGYMFEQPKKDEPLEKNVKIWALSNINEMDTGAEDWFSAEKAMDGDDESYYYSYAHSSPDYNEVLAVRTDKKTVKGMRVTPNYGGECFPKKLRFQYSQDGLIWFDIENSEFDFTDAPVTTNEPIDFIFEKSVEAKFVRLVATKLTDYRGLYALQIAEVMVL